MNESTKQRLESLARYASDPIADAQHHMAAEIMNELDRLQGELEQQRTRAEAAEQELRDAMDDASELTQSCRELQTKLAAIRAHLASWDLMALDNWARGAAKDSLIFHLLAAAREALEP